MSITKSYFCRTCLCLFLLLLLTFKAQAFPLGGIVKFLKGLGKGTKIMKPGSKITSPSSIDNILKRVDEPGFTKTLNNNRLLDKNSSHSDILEAHGVKRLGKIADGVDILEVGSENISVNNDSNLILKFFLYTPKSIYPRIIKKINKELGEGGVSRLIIDCESNKDVFTFTVLFSKEKYNWLLLSRHYPDTKLKNISNNNIESIFTSKQKLTILEANNDYIIFSNEINTKKNPTNYFIMSTDEKFVHIDNPLRIDTPEYIKNIAKKKIMESNSICLKKNI